MPSDAFNQLADQAQPEAGGASPRFHQMADQILGPRAQPSQIQNDLANEQQVIAQGRSPLFAGIRDAYRGLSNANATFNAGAKNFISQGVNLGQAAAREVEHADTSTVDPSAPEENALRAARAKQALVGMQQQDTTINAALAARPQPVFPQGVAAQAGGAIGTLGNIVAAGPFVLPAMQAEGWDTRRREVAQRPDLTEEQKGAYQLGGYAGDTAAGLLTPSAGVTAGGIPGIVAKAGLGVAEQNATNVGQNYNAQVTGVDPNRSLGQGWQAATGMGLIPAIHGAAEHLVGGAAPIEGAGNPQMDLANEHLNRTEPYGMNTQGPEKPLADQMPYDFAALRKRVEDARNQPTPEPAPEAAAQDQTAKTALEQGTFEAPGKPAPEDEAVQQALEKRLAERRQGPTEPRNEGEERRVASDRRFEDQAKGAEFQPPEQAMDKNLFAQIREAQPEETDAKPETNTLQQIAGQHAVNEEYGKPPVTTEEAPAKPNIFQRAAKSVLEGVGSVAKKVAGLGSEESGGEKFSSAFAKRTVIPAAKHLADYASDLGEALDKHMGTGINHTQPGKDARLAIRAATGKAVQEGHAFEDSMVQTGARDKGPSFSHDEASAIQAWNNLDKGAYPPTREEGKALDLIQEKRKANAARSEKLGGSMKDEEAEALSRMYVPDPESPNYKKGRAGSGSMVGAENFAKQKTFENFEDSYAAAKTAGLKLPDDNVYDNQMRVQYEVERSLAQRENLRDMDKKGSVQWVPEGQKPDEDKDTPIEDKIGTERRSPSLPTAEVAQLASAIKADPLNAPKLLEAALKRAEFVRPGEDPSDGHTIIPNARVEGTFHAQKDVARAFNENMKRGRGDALEELPRTLAALSILSRYTMGAAHAVWGTSAHIMKNVGTAVDSLIPGRDTDAQQGVQALKNLTVWGSLKRSNEVKEHVESGGRLHPELKDVVDRVMASNPGSHFKSVLDKSNFADAKKEFENNNIPAGVGHMVAGVARSIKDGIYHGALDSFDLSARRDTVERQMRQGVSAKAGAPEVAQTGDAMSMILGRHVSSPEFRNAAATAVGKLIFPAYSLKTGAARTLAFEPFRKNTAAQQMLAGGVIATMVGNAALQMILTKYNTGTAQMPTSTDDWLRGARTGNKNAAGTDERISIPGPFPYMMRQFFSGGHKAWEETMGSLNPAITGTADVIRNKDYYGNQIMPDEGNPVANAGRAVAHVAKGAVPTSVTNLSDRNPTDDRSVLDRIGGAITGIHTNHPNTSDAMDVFEKALNRSEPGGRNLKEQALYANKQKWANAIREGQKPDATPAERAGLEQARSEMSASPSMDTDKIKSVFTRASRKQGLASIVLDTKMTPAILAEGWNAASDEEKAVMKPGIMERLSKANPKTQDDRTDWTALKNQVMK